MTLTKAFYFVLTSIVLVSLAACGGGDDNDDDNNNTGTTTPEATQSSGGAQPTATSEPNSGGNTSSSELAALLTNFSKVKSFRASISLESAGQKQDGTIEAVLPDRYHFTLPGLGEVISIGNDSYIKVGNTWTKQAGGGLGNLFSVEDLSETIAGFETESQVEKGGTETVSGVRCQIYTVTDSASGTTEVCIADGLPVRISMKTGGETITIIFSDIDKAIDIQAPI